MGPEKDAHGRREPKNLEEAKAIILILRGEVELDKSMIMAKNKDLQTPTLVHVGEKELLHSSACLSLPSPGTNLDEDEAALLSPEELALVGLRAASATFELLTCLLFHSDA